VEKRPTVDVTNAEGKTETLPLYVGNETVSGTVKLTLDKGFPKVDHLGIKVSFIGVISKKQSKRDIERRLR
jgi:hypothetical protein